MPPKQKNCAWCGAPLGECNCGYHKPRLPGLNWKRIFSIFGERGMPSCGRTDARRLGSTGQESGTTYLGGSGKENKP